MYYGMAPRILFQIQRPEDYKVLQDVESQSAVITTPPMVQYGPCLAGCTLFGIVVLGIGAFVFLLFCAFKVYGGL